MYNLGIRFDDDLTGEDASALSALSSFRNAALGLPLGGGCCGLKIDPADFDEKELVQIFDLLSQYLIEKKFMGPTISIYQPDIKASTKMMDLIVDSCARQSSKKT